MANRILLRRGTRQQVIDASAAGSLLAYEPIWITNENHLVISTDSSNSVTIASLADISAVGLSGAYSDLTGKPTLGTAAAQNVDAFATAAQGAKADSSVQSVAVSVPTGFSVTGSPVTSSGTIAIAFSAGYEGYTTAEKNKLAGVSAGATANTGTVTSIDLSVPTGFTSSGGPISTTGALVLDYASGYKGFTTAESTKLAGIAAGATANTGTVTSVGVTVPTGFTASAAITTSGNVAIAYAAGYQGYTSAESSKLAGIASGATANSSDATLLARANHTGVQAIATVSGLQAALDALAPINSPSFTNGISFGNSAVTNGYDLSNHIRLYASTYGFSVTGSTLNHVSGGRHLWWSGTTNIAELAADGTFTAGTLASTGSVWASQNFVSSTANVIVATTGAGACYLRPNGAASATGQMYVNSAGALVASGNITAFSDRRIKKNIRPIEGALSKLLTLNGYTFDRTDLDAPRQTGVIAQEVMKVFPELVSHDQAADKYTVAYGNFAGVFIEAFKEEDAKIEALKKELNETKEVLAKVLARLEVLENSE